MSEKEESGIRFPLVFIEFMPKHGVMISMP